MLSRFKSLIVATQKSDNTKKESNQSSTSEVNRDVSSGGHFSGTKNQPNKKASSSEEEIADLVRNTLNPF